MNTKGILASLPYQMISGVLVCAVIVFVVALAAGILEVRRPRPKGGQEDERPSTKPASYVQRLRSAESLLEGQNVRWVYRFAGGLPKCWAEIDSEGHKQTVGPWVSVRSEGFVGADPTDRPVPGSVTGYVALFGPISREQTYRLVCGVTKVEYPPDPARQVTPRGFRNVLQPKLPDLLPPAEGPKDKASAFSSGGSYRDDGEEQEAIMIGEDAVLNFFNQDTPSGRRLNIRLMFRFLTPEEVEVARR